MMVVMIVMVAVMRVIVGVAVFVAMVVSVVMRMIVVVRMPVGIDAFDRRLGSAASAGGTHHVVSIRVCTAAQAIAVSTGTSWRAS